MEQTEFSDLSRDAIAQGCVLLKNSDGALPFTADDSVSVFGRTQTDFYKSGTGSGGSVHVPFCHNLMDGFRILAQEGHRVPALNMELMETYRKWTERNPFDTGSGEWAGEPWFQNDMPLEKEFVRRQSRKTNKALYVIGRTAGEDKDNQAKRGSWFLTRQEARNIRTVCRYFSDVVILLNVSNIMDLSWIEKKEFAGHIKSVLICWHGGMLGGLGVADVLCAKSPPSGKLSDTIAYSIKDYPSSKNFGGKEEQVYREDIFVGYRYFCTFAPGKVQFPFGHGLGYTTFRMEGAFLTQTEDSFTAKVTVKNTGLFRGMETAQVYAECPQGNLGKVRRVLCGYKKTSMLEPGESETVEIAFSRNDFSSYDDTGTGGRMLEQGEYKFFIGPSCAVTEEILFEDGTRLYLKKTETVEELRHNCAPEKSFSRLTAGALKTDGTFMPSYKKLVPNKTNLEETIASSMPKEIPLTGNKGIMFDDVTGNPGMLDDFIAQFTKDELMTLCRGEGMMSLKVTPGIAGALGGLSGALHDKYHVPVAGCSDGPSGIRLDTGEEASLIPSGTLLACTWNDILVERIYGALSDELKEKNIDILLGPGCNIHRNPLNGRNFEYYSEDPLLSGKMAAAAVRGISRSGAIATIKHFACNNQETNRRGQNSVVSERALREIYLRPFEIAVKEGGALCVMTGYNGLNGHWCSSNFGLTRGILRGEWNFSGLVMTDWWAGMTDCAGGAEKNPPSSRNLCAMVKSGTNVFMVVPNDSAENGGLGDNLSESLDNGSLSLAELQQNAREIIRFLTHTLCARDLSRPLKKETVISRTVLYPTKNADVFTADDNSGCAFAWNPEKEIFIHITQGGTYNITGTFIKDGGDGVSQSVTNVLLNGESAGAFSSRSTGGKPQSATVCQPRLEQGFYKLELKHTKPGITVTEFSIRSDKRLPPNAEKDLAHEL